MLATDSLIVICFRALSHCKHDMSALLWLNTETLESMPTPYWQTCRCPANGHSITRLHYNIYVHLQEHIPPGEMPDRIQVFAETIDHGNKVFYCTDDIPVIPDSDGRVFIQLNTSTMSVSCRRHDSSRLEPHRKYKTIITTKNEAGDSKSTGDIHFSKLMCSWHSSVWSW